MADLGAAWLAWYESVFRYARALSHDPTTAEELTQETYRRALDAARRPPSDQPEEIRRWLFTVVRHAWQNELRQRHSEQRKVADYEIQPHNPSETPATVLDRKLLRGELRRALDSLPETSREVLVLREIEGLSYAQIAAVLHCPPGTVMSRLARARAQLRHILLGNSGRAALGGQP